MEQNNSNPKWKDGRTWYSMLGTKELTIEEQEWVDNIYEENQRYYNESISWMCKAIENLCDNMVANDALKEAKNIINGTGK